MDSVKKPTGHNNSSKKASQPITTFNQIEEQDYDFDPQEHLLTNQSAFNEIFSQQKAIGTRQRRYGVLIYSKKE